MGQAMSRHGFQYRYRGPRNTPEERGGKPPVYSRTVENGHAMLIERDLAVPLRDGAKGLRERLPPGRRAAGAADHCLEPVWQACAV